MNLSRRGFVAGLLAAPVVIRTRGLLMPIKPALADLPGGFSTDNLIVVAYERYSCAWGDWRGMWGSGAGDMNGFPLTIDGEYTVTDPNVDLAMARMKDLRRLEERAAELIAERARELKRLAGTSRTA